MRQMRWGLAIWLSLAGIGAAQDFADPFAGPDTNEVLDRVVDANAVDVRCAAVSFDDHSERMRDVPDGPHPVQLMVVAKVRKPPAVKKPAKKPKADDDSFLDGEEYQEGQRLQSSGVELVIERVLFGSPPGKEIHVEMAHAFLPEDCETKAHIYGVTAAARAKKPAFSLDGYFSLDREMALEDLPGAEALARARLDYHVLSSRAIFVGELTDKAKGCTSVVVKRVLHGDLKVGDAIETIDHWRGSVPVSETGPLVYFVSDIKADKANRKVYEVCMRWTAETIDTIVASLARRSEYPIKEVKDEDGESHRTQEITFRGPRREAIAMLRHRDDAIEILGARRLLTDEKAAVPDIVAAIEKHLWSAEIDNKRDFQLQANLIRMLGLLEDHRTDGEVVRLIGEVLTKAETGETFPSPPVAEDDELNFLRRGSYRRELASDSNHSLAWLLLSLQEQDAARLFGERLLKLRDLTAYGWKDDAQFVLDESHLEDHLELVKVEPKSQQLKPVEWTGGFSADGLDYYKVAFSRDGKWFAAVNHNAGKVWNTKDWTLAGEFKHSGSVSDVAFSSDGKSLYIAGGGATAILHRLDWRKSAIEQKFTGHKSSIASMQLSRDGKLLLSSDGYSGTTRLFDTTDGICLDYKDDYVNYDLKLSNNNERFLARREKGWWIGHAQSTHQDKLDFAARDVVWAKEDQSVWSLEERAEDAKPAEKKPLETRPEIDSAILPGPLDPGEDPFDFGPRLKPAVIRLRDNEEMSHIALERKLSFPATTLLTSEDGSLLVALGNRQAEIFRGPDWKSVGSWQFPASPKGIANRLERGRRSFALSADGKYLAMAQEYAYFKIFETISGKQLPLSSAHESKILSLKFAANDVLQTQDVDGVALQWNAINGKQLADRKAIDEMIATDEEDQQSTFRDESGQVWSFQGQGGGKYGRYSAYKVFVGPAGSEDDSDDLFDDESPEDKKPAKKPSMRKLIGEIQTRWGMLGPLGLVPGGNQLHIGTQIYSLSDLKPISAANVSGRIESLEFNSDGRRYVVVTSETESRPTPLGIDVRRIHIVSQRLRVYDTRSGEAVLVIPSKTEIEQATLSPDGKRVACLFEGQQIKVWAID